MTAAVTTDTIFALATPPGRGGVAVVRVSGPAAAQTLTGLGAPQPRPRQAALRRLKDPVSRETLDEALVLYFAGPASFTGEDCVEYHVHGGRAVVQSVLAVLGRLPGCRMAEPGEFTRRAFENGRIDLTAAEAVADLVDAETQAQQQQALAQMGGALSDLYDGWRTSLTRILAHLEADIDFPDEDLPQGVAAQVCDEIAPFIEALAAHLNDNRRGERLRDGLRVAVIGAPNAGKSSLVNALAQRDVAIVSAQAGTTRDVIEVHLDVGGYPVILADTAGLRPDQLGDSGADILEGEGIKRALRWAESADIRLLLYDAGQWPEKDSHTAALAGPGALEVFNKSDVLDRGGDEAAPEGRETAPLMVSAKTGAGLDDLLSALLALIPEMIGQRTAPSLTRARHRAALEECQAALERALAAPLPELMAEDVRLAVRALGRITGRVDVEDLLDVIFRDFCIGK